MYLLRTTVILSSKSYLDLCNQYSEWLDQNLNRVKIISNNLIYSETLGGLHVREIIHHTIHPTTNACMLIEDYLTNREFILGNEAIWQEIFARISPAATLNEYQWKKIKQDVNETKDASKYEQISLILAITIVINTANP